MRWRCWPLLCFVSALTTIGTASATSDPLHEPGHGKSEGVHNSEIDANGYIAYCPCMGRFGNQADQFLGALAFAKRLNRTLILPPWVEYIPFKAGSLQIPFDSYFDPNATAEYHRVILMENFMEHLAPYVWPRNKRISFCYAERGKGKGCDAKDGNPFGPFWDRFNIDFVRSELFGPELHYSTFQSEMASWTRYTGAEWPVLAFVGPPSVFPVEKENVHLQEYLVWNKDIEYKALYFISSLPKGRFVGIHLRNGIDWLRACEHVDESRQLFASPQCTGYRNEYGSLTRDICFPQTHTIVAQLIEAVKKANATSVFVASDNYPSPHVDLAILGKSNLFIANCVSSFSAFVKRERDLKGFPSEFWAFKPKIPHQEL